MRNTGKPTFSKLPVTMRLLCLLATLALTTAGPIVQIDQGKLEGQVVKSRPTLFWPEYIAFKGIPYAQPPVHSLRFKPPLLPLPWNGTRNAAREGNICTQLTASGGNAACNKFLILTLEMVLPQATPVVNQECDSPGNMGDEDCLFINVFTQRLPDLTGFKLKPVMVWIHGGGFTSGSGNSDILGPNFLLQDDVVVCTLNYRLGAFGFMSLNNMEISGNMGLKDQAMAFKWVQKNIHKFGGDPNKVTIFGQSSGAVSVHAHLLSPMSKGLFSSAISESGSLLDPWGFGLMVYNYSRTLVDLLGCNSPPNQLHCLQGFSTETITNKTREAVLPVLDSYTYYLPFTPTVEPLGAADAFLTTDPINCYKSGNVTDVPFLTGVNSEEAYILKPYIDSIPDYFEVWSQRSETFIPKNLDPSKYNTTALMEEVKEFYFGDRNVSKKTIQNYFNMVSDIGWVNGARETLKWQALVNQEPTYSYQFAFSGFWNYGKLLAGDMNRPGASHGDEIPYLWYTGLQLVPLVTYLTPTRVTSRRMVTMWTNFAKTGNPTSDLYDGFLTPKLIPWPPYTTANHSCLKIDNKLSVMPELDKRRADFWDQIYRQYGYN